MAPFLDSEAPAFWLALPLFLVLCIFAYLFNYATIVYSNIHNYLSFTPQFNMCFLYKFTFRSDFYTNSC